MTPERYKKMYKMLSLRQPSLTVVMEKVHKAHNLAAIARTCDAVGIPQIHAVTHHEILNMSQDAASGSGRWVDVHTHDTIDDAYGHLRTVGMKILAAHFSEDAIDFRAIDYTKPTAIIVGQELEGISDEAVEKADGSIIIPMYGMVQSLNVSVATALILYEAQRQRQNAGLYNSSHYNEPTIQKIIFEKGYPHLAQKYQRENKPYPKLDPEGQIITR